MLSRILNKFPVFQLRQVYPYSTQSYHLKYGAVLYSNQDLVKAHSPSSPRPLVVIMGWNDCKLKHLKKYSDIFENKGWSTICLPTKSFNTFFRSSTEVKRIAKYLADVIKDKTEKSQQVFLYTFSNGGCSIYFHLAETLTSNNSDYNSINVIGSIFDSCPVKPTMESISRVQISVTEQIKNPIIRPIVWYAIRLFLPIMVKTNPTIQRFFNDLGKIRLKCPQLFLYSKADYLAFNDDVDEHIRDRKAMDIMVLSKCWDDSQHVQHYMKYPQEYLQQIGEFLSLCLKSQT